MKVGIFYSSITNLQKAPHKANLMDVFKAGVLANGDQVVEYRTPTDQIDPNLDAGFVLGYSIGQNYRRKIIDTLASNNSYRVFVDSNILNYACPQHNWHRYSMNSVYPNDGIYFFDQLDSNKWNEYSSLQGVDLKPWRSTGKHILVLCQRPKGWNMFAPSQDSWLDDILIKIRQHTNRPIRLRMHPGDGNKHLTTARISTTFKDVSISTEANIKDDLVDCWCTVGYNSTPNAVAAIEGVPGYIEDPLHSWATGVAFTDLAQIENPPLVDRTDWLTRIANIHWSNEEVRSGKLWSAIKKYISSAR